MYIHTIKMKAKYPNLDRLLNDYFTLDWEYDYDSPEAVIRDFIDRGMKAVEDIIIELKTLLSYTYTPKEWESILYDVFDCEYYFDYEKQYTPREWLEKVLHQFEEALLLSRNQQNHANLM